MRYLKKVVTVFSVLTVFVVLLPLTTMTLLSFLGFRLEHEVGVYFVTSGTIPLIMLLGTATYLLVGFVISGVSLSTYLWLNPRSREIERFRSQLGDLMSVFISQAMAGSPIIEALKKTAEFVGPPASRYLETYVYLVTIGEDPLRAEAIVTRGLPKEVKLVFASVSQAMKSGGRYLEVLSQAEKYLRQLITLTDLRKNKLSEYKLVLVLSVVAYAFSAIVTLKLVTSMGASVKGIPLITGQININLLKSAYYISTLILTGITSVIISKAVEGHVIKSLKYTSMLTLLVTAMFVASELV
ncbi:MAG: type II secretion system F family protein [Thermoprotei archaeon]